MIATVAMFGVEGFTTEDTGVWAHHPVKGPSKLCSLGTCVCVCEGEEGGLVMLSVQVYR